MADQPIGTAEVAIRAKLDDFERDLAAVQQKLQSLSQVMDKATESTKKFGQETDAAASKLAGLKETLTSLKDFTIGAFTDAVRNLASSTASYFEPLARAIDNAREKTERFQRIIAEAATAGVSADTFQRMQQSASKFNLSASQATDTLQRFAKATQQEFGGSLFDRTLLNLQQAGNFLGNAGVQAYRAASTTEDRFKAVVSIINTAMEKGERLAAIKLAESFLPGDVLQRLREGNQFLGEWATKAAAVKGTDIVSTQQLANAAELKRRMDDVIKAWTTAPAATEEWKNSSLDFYRVWVNIAELGTKLASSSWWKSLFQRDKPVSVFPEGEIRALTELVQKMSPGGAIGPGTGGAQIPYEGAGPLQAGFAGPTNQQLLSRSPSLISAGLELQRNAVKALKDAYGGLETVLGTNIKGYENYNKVIENNEALVKASNDAYDMFRQSAEERLGVVQKETDELASRNEKLEAFLRFRARAQQAGPLSGIGFGEAPQTPGLTMAFGISLTRQTAEQARETLVLNAATKEYKNALNQLAVGMSDYNNIARARVETESAIKDMSKEMEGLFNRQVERLSRSIGMEEARAQAIGKGAAAEGRLRVELSLREAMEAAAIRDQKVFIDTITLSVEKQNELRIAAVNSGKTVVEYTQMQADAVKKMAERSGQAAEAFQRMTMQQRADIQTQSLGLNLTKDQVEVYSALIPLFGSLEAARKSELATQMLGNKAAERSGEITRDRAIVSKRYSQEDIEIANRLRAANGETYKDIETALKSVDAERIKSMNTEKQMIALEREHYIVAKQLSSEQRAIADALKGRFSPDAAGVRAALQSPEGRQMAANQQLERMNELRRQTQLITSRISDDEVAIAEALKGQTLNINEALRSEAAREMRKANQLKLERDLGRELKLSVGYTDEERQIAEKLFHKFRDADEAIRSWEGGIVRTTIRLREVQNIATEVGTSMYTTFVGQLREGIKAGEAWKWTMLTAARQVVDKLAEMAIKFAVIKTLGAVGGFFGFGGGGADPTKELGAGAAAAGVALTEAGVATNASLASGGLEAGTAIETAATLANGALLAGGTEAGAALEAGGALAAGSITAGAFTASASLEAAGALVSGAMIAGATEAAVILTAAKVPLLGLRQGGVVGFPGLPRFQQGGIPGDPDAVPMIAHRGEEVIRRDDPRHSLNRGDRALKDNPSPTININFTANGRMTSRDIQEHAQTIAKQVAKVFNKNPAMRRTTGF